MKNKNVKRFELRLSEKLYRLIKKTAEKDRRSIHNHLIISLERIYEKHDVSLCVNSTETMDSLFSK